MIALRAILWFLADMALKFVVGVGIVMCVWLLLSTFLDLSPRPWLVGGAIFGACLNGLWDLSDVIGLKRRIGSNEDREGI
jgi:hypothetical protein